MSGIGAMKVPPNFFGENSSIQDIPYAQIIPDEYDNNMAYNQNQPVQSNGFNPNNENYTQQVRPQSGSVTGRSKTDNNNNRLPVRSQSARGYYKSNKNNNYNNDNDSNTQKKSVPFYNTLMGEPIIHQTRKLIGARPPPANYYDNNNHHNYNNGLGESVQNNRQRNYHTTCFKPNYLPNAEITTKPIYQPYPIQEFGIYDDISYNILNPRFLFRKISSRPFNVQTRHDLQKGLNKHLKATISSYNYNKPFLAKHTNNLCHT